MKLGRPHTGSHSTQITHVCVRVCGVSTSVSRRLKGAPKGLQGRGVRRGVVWRRGVYLKAGPIVPGLLAGRLFCAPGLLWFPCDRAGDSRC